MGVVETHAPGGQSIDVGRLDLRMTIAAEIAIQIVADEEKDIGPVRRVGDGWEENPEGDNPEEQTNTHAGRLAKSGAPARTPPTSISSP